MSNKNKLRTYILVRVLLRIILAIYIFTTLANITSAQVSKDVELGIVLEVFPLPGETCEEGELFVKVQLRDSIVTLTDEKDWYTLYDKVGKEVSVARTTYTFRDGTIETFYYAK